MADSRLLTNAARPTWQRKAVHGKVVSIYYSSQRWFIGIRSAGEVLARSANKSESDAPTDVVWQVCSGPASWHEVEWLTVRLPDKESRFAAFGKILKLSHSAAKEKARADKEALRRSTIAIQNSNPMGIEMAKLKEKFRGEEKDTKIYPRGWSEGVDDTSGEVIYINEFTGDTTAEEPMLPAPPIGYSVETDDESGHVYFHNLETGESQWTHPLGEQTQKKSRRLRSTLPPGRLRSIFTKRSPMKEEEDAAAANALPRGWGSAKNDEGHTYYINEVRIDEDSVWEKPTLPAPPEGWSVAAHEDDVLKCVWTNNETGETSFLHPLGALVVKKRVKKLRLKTLVSLMKKPKKGEDAAAANAVLDSGDAWFYASYLDDTQHGPYTLQQLHDWLKSNDLDADLVVCQGRTGAKMPLYVAIDSHRHDAAGGDADPAVREAGDDNWFYTDADDKNLLQGPHSGAQLQEWVEGGHFALTQLVRNGRTGDLVELASALHVAPAAAGDASAATGTDSDLMGTDDNWFYTDKNDEALLHGPFSVADLQEWVTDGHFALNNFVRNGRTGTPVELSSVLLAEPVAAAGSASRGAASDSTGKDDNWFYVDADDEAVLHGPHNIAELQEWFDGGHLQLTQPVRHGRTGDLVELSSALPS